MVSCLAIDGVTVVRAGRRVVESATLALDAGAVVTVQGASGSGKSSLLRAIATLIAIDAGTITFRGRDVRTIDIPDYRRHVAYVPQLPPMFEGTVADNVRAGPAFRGVALSDAAVTARVAQVGLDAEVTPRRASTLSGGERLRVALARALANEPVALLLDEPTSALDPTTAHVILDLVAGLARGGMAILAVTHLEEHAMRLGGARHEMTCGVLRPIATP